MSTNTAPSVSLGIEADETTEIERPVFLGSFVEASTGQRVATYRIADCEFEIVELPVADLAPPTPVANWRAVAL
jgi:Golgi nucleoside diphosphatase